MLTGCERTNLQVVKVLKLFEINETLLEEFEARKEAHDDFELRVDTADEVAETDRLARWQQRQDRLDGFAHTHLRGVHVIGSDRRHDLGRERLVRGRVQLLERNELERVGRQQRKRFFGTSSAGENPSVDRHALIDVARRVLEGLALKQPRQQIVAFFPTGEFFIEVDRLRRRQQAARFEFDQRRGDEQELGGHVEVNSTDLFRGDEILVDDRGKVDVPEIDFLLQNQVQQQVKGTLKYRSLHCVAHRWMSVVGGITSMSSPGRIPPNWTRWKRRNGTRVAEQGQLLSAPMPRVFSGIKPTGEMQLGNFCGAVQRWVAGQPAPGNDDAQSGANVFCVVDLHAMTVPYDPADLRRMTREIATLLLASGIDPQRSLLFVQSHVGAIHSECTWLLNNTATVGELRRMTQFKEKSDGQESVSVGLFDYPVLMAADILLYNTEEVPVGDDQRQHVELTRDIAIRFNQRFGETFVIPKATFPASGARIMDLQNPTKKMSKSDGDSPGCVFVLDAPKAIAKKIKTAVTDSDTVVRYDPAEKPGVSNLLDIFAAATGRSAEAAEAEFAGSRYGELKVGVADAVIELLAPVQQRYAELNEDPQRVDEALAAGRASATEIATGVMERVRDAVGLLAPT